ncbi:MAG: tRNA lysidine(34) synthetase TilS [Verrucomicrobiales bacterium]|nr:tRNA lysidine(34) synthetase TilS [Verrucomicrobiales bacterium]
MNEESSILPGSDPGLICADISYLVGVSGGRDSVVLLYWLKSQGIKNLVVCHFNHGLSGEDSDGDERFVAQKAEAMGFDCIRVKNDSAVYAKLSRQSLETAARESRYRFFARVAKERSCQRLILAHHADDQVETVLMNLFRGSGLNGLSGMEPVSHRKIEGLPLEIIRPFLNVSRESLEKYREERGLDFREDSTNSELIATRNRVRHELLPLANDIFSRDVSPAVLRLSKIVELEYSSAQIRAGRWLSAQRMSDGNLPVKALRQLVPADLNHVLHLWLKGWEIKDCGFLEVMKISEMVRSDDKPAKINLPGHLYARRRSGIIFISAE